MLEQKPDTREHNAESHTNQVGRQFGRQATRYDAVSGIQALLASKLWKSIAGLAPQSIGSVLDIGAGTGHLSIRLAKLKPTSIHLLDLSAEMLAEARARLLADASDAEIYLHQANAEQWKPTPASTRFDLVASSAAIQWFHDLDLFCQRAASWTSSRGLVALATFGPRTLNELNSAYFAATGQALTPGTRMVSANELQASLERAGLSVRIVETQVSFTEHESPIAVLRDLKSMGVTGANARSSLTRTSLEQLESELKQSSLQSDGKIRCTWELVWAVAEG